MLFVPNLLSSFNISICSTWLFILFRLLEGRSYLQITDFFVPSQVLLNEIANFNCQYDFGEDTPNVVKLYRDRNQFFQFTFKGDPLQSSSIVPLAGVIVKSSRVTETGLSIALQITDMEATGLYSCEITADQTFMTTSSSREMQVVENSDSLNEQNELPLQIHSAGKMIRQLREGKAVIAPTPTNSTSDGTIRNTVPKSQLKGISTASPSVKEPYPTELELQDTNDSNFGISSCSNAGYQEAHLEFLFKYRAQLNLNLLNVIVPFFQSIQRNLTTLVSFQAQSSALTDYKIAHDSIEDSLVKMEHEIRKNRLGLMNYWSAYDKAEKQLRSLGRVLSNSLSSIP